ncbi:ribosome recycling factor [Xylariaceae sp. FL0255]|nr:ribosome recycling factor [Xylariaceae sp. FL0255]
MSNAVARTLLRQSLVRSEARRTHFLPIGSSSALCVEKISSRYHVTRPAATAAFLTSRSTSSSSLLFSQQKTPTSREILLLRNPNQLRTFQSSSHKLKKKKQRGDEDEEEAPTRGGKKSKSKSKSKAAPAEEDDADAADGEADLNSGPKHPRPDPDNPLDFADVKSRLDKHAERFKPTLKKLQAGTRFDADAIGSLQAQAAVIPSSSSPHNTYPPKSPTFFPLRDLAQVVPQAGGRVISILVHEESYVKQIMSAVQNNPDFNQQPQRDPENPLELTIKIEATTREEQVRRVKASAHEWRERIRAVRQRRDKVHTNWFKARTIGPDAKRAADKDLEKIIKTAIGVVDTAEKDVLKSIEKK